MSKTRVLVVDDSVAVRKIVTDILSECPEIEVAGTAPNGKIGLAKIEQLNPDLVILDIEMPVMDGLETLAEIRKTRKDLPIVMFSSLTAKGAETTLDALALGANAYATKPSGQTSPDAATQSVREDLIPLIRGLSRKIEPVAPKMEAQARNIAVNSQAANVPQKRVDILAIGISTGGPNALAEMMPTLPGDIPVPIVIVQHMPPMFTGYLAKRLDANCKYQVREAEEGDVLEPGTCWIAPGDLHMTVEPKGKKFIVGMNEGPPENHCRPAVDVLFRSVAEVFGPRSLSVVMTGMGQDGLLGCEHLRKRGGQVLAQDEASSMIWSMPGCVSRAGLAHKTVPLDELGAEIMERIAFGRSKTKGLN
ncbi:MAG: chemotaxis response regulator protein-glutamate methylesterase [Myxococcota bacterium]